MAGRVCVHLEAGCRIDVWPAPENACPECQDFCVGLVGVGDHEVGVDLLPCAVGPVRWRVVGRELDADDGDVVDEDQVDAPEVADHAVEQACPEAALRRGGAGRSAPQLPTERPVWLLSLGRRAPARARTGAVGRGAGARGSTGPDDEGERLRDTGRARPTLMVQLTQISVAPCNRVLVAHGRYTPPNARPGLDQIAVRLLSQGPATAVSAATRALRTASHLWFDRDTPIGAAGAGMRPTAVWGAVGRRSRYAPTRRVWPNVSTRVASLTGGSATPCAFSR